jgi:hypothetical protein
MIPIHCTLSTRSGGVRGKWLKGLWCCALIVCSLDCVVLFHNYLDGRTPIASYEYLIVKDDT